MASPLQESQPHGFMQEELTRALSEQAFGIASYEVLSSSPLKAVARVVLLENDTILVSLTGRGYQLYSPTEPPNEPDTDASIIFETAEQLLQSASPMYEAARRSALVAKLNALMDDDA